MKVEFENIDFKYPKSDYLFKNLNLHIEEGNFVFILGPNGSGKSSLISLILRKYLVQKGTIKLNGDEISSIDLPEHIGYIPQSYSLDNEMFVEDTIDFIASLNGISGKQLKQRKEGIVETFQIQHLLSKKIKKLSGGQKQIVNIVLGVLHDPDLVLLDEPFVGLDFEVKSTVVAALQNLNKTIVCISHDLDVAESIADKAIIMSNGAIIENEHPAELIQNNPYCLYEIRFKSTLNTEILEQHSDFHLTEQHNMLTISFPANSDLEKRIHEFEELNSAQITSIKVDKNSLKSTIAGLHKLDLKMKNNKKGKKGKNK